MQSLDVTDQAHQRLLDPTLMGLRPLHGLQKVEQGVEGHRGGVDGQERVDPPGFAPEGRPVATGHVSCHIEPESFHAHPGMDDVSEQIEHKWTSGHKPPSESGRHAGHGRDVSAHNPRSVGSDATGVLSYVKLGDEEDTPVSTPPIPGAN